MPVDNEGNITTTPSVVVKTITDLMRENNLDTIALHDGGMARVAKDDGTGVVLTASTSTPKA